MDRNDRMAPDQFGQTCGIAVVSGSGHGQAHFTVAPADRPGWYMTVLEDCD